MFTVKVTALVVTGLHGEAPETIAWYWYPFILAVIPVNNKVAEVAPDTVDQVVPLVLTCHWYAKLEPVAATVNEAAPAVQAETLDGGVVIATAVLTESVAAFELTTPFTTQRNCHPSLDKLNPDKLKEAVSAVA